MYSRVYRSFPIYNYFINLLVYCQQKIIKDVATDKSRSCGTQGQKLLANTESSTSFIFIIICHFTFKSQ